MNQTQAKRGYAKVWLNKEQIIVSELHGFIDEDITKVSMAETKRLANELHAKGKPVRLLIDGLNVISQTSGARTSTRALADMDISKLAVIGKGITTPLVAQYLMRVSGIKGEAKSFRTTGLAEKWLLQKKDETQTARRSGIFSALLLFALVAGVLAGWIFKNKTLTELTPDIVVMNPMVAVTFLFLAIIPVLLAVRKPGIKVAKQWFIGIVLAWTMLLGFLVWARIVFDINTNIDSWLFSDQITAATHIAPRTAFNLLLVGVMILSVLTGQNRKWEKYAFYVAALAAAFNASIAALGYAFGYGLADYTNFVPMPLTTAFCFLILVNALWPFSKPLPFFARLRNFVIKYQLVLAVFVIVMAITGFSWQQSKADLNNNKKARIAQAFAKEQNTLNDRISSYTSMLYGFRSLFEASSDVSVDEFTVYFASSEIQQRYPGLNGMAYVAQVPSAEKQAYQVSMRKQATAANPQYKTFTIKPQDSQQPLSYILTYIEPDKNVVKLALGYDLSSSNERLNILQAARDTGLVKTTGTININSAVLGVPKDASIKESPGFFMAAPIYYDEAAIGEPKTVQDRRNRLTGFINASFVYQELFADIFNDESRTDLQFVVSDVDTNSVLYKYNPNAKDIEKEAKYESNISIGGRSWRLAMYTNKTFGTTVAERALSFIVLVGGSLLAVLAALLVLSQTRRREAAILLAGSMTEDLNSERNEAVASKQRDDAILSSIADGVFVIDIKGRIILFNPSTEQLSGYTAAEAMGKRYQDILRFEDSRSFAPKDGFIKQALNGRVAHMKNHTALVRKDGSRIIVADSAAPLRDYQNKTVGAIVVFRDVTKEAALDRAKDEFVSLASHQLRTPLSSIKWYAEMLLNGDAGRLGKNQKEDIQEIYDGNERMIALVNSLLDVSRMDLGKFINEPADVSIPNMVRSLEKEMTEATTAKKITLKTDFAPKLPAVYVDPKLARAIIQNLMSNAIKYTAAKGAVTISARMAKPSECSKYNLHVCSRYLAFTVADTGYGIPKAQQGRIFEKLFRADNIRPLEVEGTGLGLYLVKQIVEKLGGKIWFESKEDVGTTFYVLLPIRTAKATIAHDTI